MKAFFQIDLLLLLASATCASAISAAPASTRLFKREAASSTSTSSRPGPTVNARSTVLDPNSEPLIWYNGTDNAPWEANTGCSCAQLSPKECYDSCGYFGIERTDPETGEAYSYSVPNGFTRKKKGKFRRLTYKWPKTVNPNFVHRGGAGQSYNATPTDDNPYFDYPPFQLNASTAAALYPGDWPEKVYMWWFTYTDGGSPDHPEHAVTCLCAASKDCGCAPQAWLVKREFDAQGTGKNITSMSQEILEVVVNGTATVEDLKEEEKLIAEDEESERKKAEYTGSADFNPNTGARGLVVGWGFLGLVMGVGFVCQY